MQWVPKEAWGFAPARIWAPLPQPPIASRGGWGWGANLVSGCTQARTRREGLAAASSPSPTDRDRRVSRLLLSTWVQGGGSGASLPWRRLGVWPVSGMEGVGWGGGWHARGRGRRPRSWNGHRGRGCLCLVTVHPKAPQQRGSLVPRESGRRLWGCHRPSPATGRGAGRGTG